jgi:hypothetical protein
MPTCADVQLRVRHKLVTMMGTEVPEPLLRGMCSALAILALAPSEALSVIAGSDPTAVARGRKLLACVARRFAEELALVEETCMGMLEEARARGLRGAALDAWCVTRLDTELIGHPRRRRVKTPR